MEQTIQVTPPGPLDEGVRMAWCEYEHDYHEDMAINAAMLGGFVGPHVDAWCEDVDGELFFFASDETIGRSFAVFLKREMDALNAALPEDSDLFEYAEYLGNGNWELSS